jgi:hypothetical protein
VLRQVHDVPFALASRWPPRTVYLPASQEAWVDVACVVQSVVRGSLFDGALADILTSAEPSPTGQRSHRLTVVMRPPGYGYLVFADARHVYSLLDE